MDDVEMHSSGRTEPVQLAQWSLKNPGRSIYYTLRLLWWGKMGMGMGTNVVSALCSCTLFFFLACCARVYDVYVSVS